jgi:hypothetical protein
MGPGPGTDKTDLSDFAALVLGVVLMAQFKGSIGVPDFGSIGRQRPSRRKKLGVTVPADEYRTDSDNVF